MINDLPSNLQLDYPGSNKQSNLRETIKLLPTPEMSPVETNEQPKADPNGQYQTYGLLGGHHKVNHHTTTSDLHSPHHHQSHSHHMYQNVFHHYQPPVSSYKQPKPNSHEMINSPSPMSSQVKTENPFNELLSRFSGSSTFLRNVCPPYSYRAQPNRTDSMVDEIQQQQQRNCSQYSPIMDNKSSMNYQFEQPPPPRSMLQHQLELPINDSRSSTSYNNSNNNNNRSWNNTNSNLDRSMYDMNRVAANSPYSMYNNNKMAETKNEMLYSNSTAYATNEHSSLYYGQVNNENSFGDDSASSFHSHFANAMGTAGHQQLVSSNSMGHPSTVGNELSPISTSMSLMNSNYEPQPPTDTAQLLSPLLESVTAAGTARDQTHNHCDTNNSELIAALAETREIIS